MYLLHKKHSCEAMTKNKLKVRKCVRSKKCHIVKCGNLFEDYNKSQLTEKDLQECMKYENNMNKAMKCKDDVELKKGLDIKQGKIEQCIALECPQSHNIDMELLKDLQKKLNNNNKNNSKSVKCKKINKEIENVAIQRLNITNECNKKHQSYKKQQECIKPISNKILSINYKLEKCMKTNNQKTNNQKTNNQKNK